MIHRRKKSSLPLLTGQALHSSRITQTQDNFFESNKMQIVIIGGGPSGIFTALLLAEQGHGVTLLEANRVIGGCHRVDRVDGVFSEHGPRIYVTNYLNYKTLLDLCGISFDDHYVPYKYGFISAGIDGVMTRLHLSEVCTIVLSYVAFMLAPSIFDKRSVKDVCRHFAPSSLKILDNMCKLTDGAGVERYTMRSFLELVNQNLLYKIVEPKAPNDSWLWPAVQEKLTSLGVRVVHQAVTAVTDDSTRVTGVRTSRGLFFEGDAVIVATPPLHTAAILQRSSPLVASAFGVDIQQYMRDNTYDTYVSFTIHLDPTYKDKLPKVWGRPTNDWNVAWIVMSDYFVNEAAALISATIFDLDQKSSHTNLTANETSDAHDLVTEATRQVLTALKITASPRHIVLNPRVFRRDGQWSTSDMPFMRTPKSTPVSSVSSLSGLYWVGPHNMNNRYAFTSMENVCENVIAFCNSFQTPGRRRIQLRRAWTVNGGVYTTLCFLICAYIFRFMKRRHGAYSDYMPSRFHREAWKNGR